MTRHLSCRTARAWYSTRRLSLRLTWESPSTRGTRQSLAASRRATRRLSSADVRPPTVREGACEEAAVSLEARPQEVEVRSLDLDDDVPVGVPELCRARVQRRECRLSGWWDPRPLWRRTRQDGCRNGSILTRSRLWLTSFVLHGQRLDGGGCSRREARRRSMRSGLCMSFRLGLVHLRGVDSGSSSRHRPRRYILRLLLLGS